MTSIGPGGASFSMSPTPPPRKPHFSGLFTNRDENTGTVRPRTGRIAAVAAAAVLTPLVPFALVDRVVPTERCAITNVVTGNVGEAGPGLTWRPWLFYKSICFPTSTDARVTETVNGRSAEGISIKVPVSIAWKPATGHIPSVFKKVYGKGGTDDQLLGPDGQSSKAQIKGENLDALYENAMYSEFRSMIEDVAALIPASQPD